jgi:hypothetical protein
VICAAEQFESGLGTGLGLGVEVNVGGSRRSTSDIEDLVTVHASQLVEDGDVPTAVDLSTSAAAISNCSCSWRCRISG